MRNCDGWAFRLAHFRQHALTTWKAEALWNAASKWEHRTVSNLIPGWCCIHVAFMSLSSQALVARWLYIDANTVLVFEWQTIKNRFCFCTGPAYNLIVCVFETCSMHKAQASWASNHRIEFRPGTTFLHTDPNSAHARVISTVKLFGHF